MKKILSVILTVCMLVSLTVVYTTAASDERCATLKAANNCGYGVWDFDNNQIIVHIVDDTVWNRVTTMRTFIGFVVSSTAQDWGSTGIRKDPTASNGQGCAQYGGTVVAGSVNAETKTFAYTMGQNIKEVIEGKNTDTGSNFRTLVENYGGIYAVRIDTNNQAGTDYLGYCLPVYDEAPDGLRLTDAYFDSSNQIIMRFNAEVDQVNDYNVTPSGRANSIYQGVGKFCAIRIVDNTTNWNLQYDSGTPAQWGASLDANCTWNWPEGLRTNAYTFDGSVFGCNSFEDICKLVDKGGKFEGCVVAFCIEELNGSNHSDKAQSGDGYINSVFANGSYNDINYVLKANRVVSGQYDGAYVTMYDPADNGDNLNAPVISWDDDGADSDIEHLYINALVEDDGTYGILFAEDTYATDAQMKLPSDGGSPLFSRILTARTAILQSGAYGTSEITAVNLGGESTDKVLAMYWTNMPSYTTFAARVYKVLDNGTVIYGPITTVNNMNVGSGNLPLAD